MMPLTMKSMRFILLVLGCWIVLASSGHLYAADDPLAEAGILRGRGKMSAPLFELEDLEGKPIRLEDFRGNVALLSFWATW